MPSQAATSAAAAAPLDHLQAACSRDFHERGCANGVPFAVTCGIYGWFFHTRFVGSEVEAEFPAMRDGLGTVLDVIPRADDPAADTKMAPVCEAIEAFISRFP